MQIETVIVACERDWSLIPDLVASIQSRFEPGLVSRINLIWNEPQLHNESRYLRKLRKRVSMAGSRSPVRWLDCLEMDPLLGRTLPGSWYSQQYLKTIACEWVDTDYYMVLDCKDIFIADVKASDVFDADGRSRVMWDRVADMNQRRLARLTREQSGHLESLEQNLHFGHAWLMCRMVWQHRMNGSNTPWIYTSSTTPFSLHTASTRQMTQELRQRLGGFFPYLYQCMIPEREYPMITEFHLYTQYLNSSRSFETVHSRVDLANTHDSDNLFCKVKKRDRGTTPSR